MALTNSQYDTIMRGYDRRQYENYRRQCARTDEIYEKFPRIREIQEAMSACSIRQAERLFDEEPDALEIRASKKKKPTGKKNEDLSGIPVQRIDHYMTEGGLTAEFGEKGWKQLPDAISRCYRFVPAKVEVEEHHIGVYASKTDEHMVKAPHPKNLLRGSLVSPSLAAAVINGKYVNAVPLYRLEKEFERYGLAITRQNMAN